MGAPAKERSRLARWLKRGVIGAVVVFVAIQFVPYGWWHENPPVVQAAPWPSAGAADLARTSCYSCHSNETDWPAYSYVAPMSWLVRRDVEAGRDELNFSRWDEDDGEADDAAEAVADGSMPPDRYTMMHPDARLTEDEERLLIAALEAMDAGRGGGDEDNSGPGGGGDDD